MNGISLLLLLSSLGATTSVEMAANGQPVYTIRIESLLVSELLAGQPVPILVAPRDRQIKQFKIAMTSDSNVRGSSARASDFNSRTGDLFDYEPRELENGEIEYLIQISPERLESLAAGKPIEGVIAPQIAEVHRYLIFVGMRQLPSQQAAAPSQTVAQAGTGNVPSLLRGAEVRATPASQTRTVTSGTTPYGSNANTLPAGQRGFSTSSDPLTNFNRSNDPRTALRNQPDQSTVSPPSFITAGQPSTTAANNGFSRTTVPTTAPTYNPVYSSQQPPTDGNPAYAQPNPYGQSPQQPYGTNTVPYAQQPPLQQQAAPAPTVVRNDLAPANTGMPAAPNWAANHQVAPAQATIPAAVPVSTVAKAEERPWTPLILTTLALFASLGANAYLGWLAWSFFWRFRDAITESARARAQLHSRQAA